MTDLFKGLLRTICIHLRGRRKVEKAEIGLRVTDDQVTRRRVELGNTQRTMHIAVVGKSGSGKSSLLKYLSKQDIEADRGFVYFDLHGDATPFLLRAIAA